MGGAFGHQTSQQQLQTRNHLAKKECEEIQYQSYSWIAHCMLRFQIANTLFKFSDTIYKEQRLTSVLNGIPSAHCLMVTFYALDVHT